MTFNACIYALWTIQKVCTSTDHDLEISVTDVVMGDALADD